MQTKLLAAFGVVVALMVGLGAFAVARLGSDDRHIGQLASVEVPGTRAVGEIGVLMNKYRKDQFHYIVAKPADRPANVPGGVAGDLQDDLVQMRGYWRGYASRHLLEDRADHALFTGFQRDFLQYVAATEGFKRLADAGKGQESANLLGDGRGDQLWDTLKADIVAWSNHKVATAEAAARASRSNYHEGVLLIIALLAVAVTIAVIVAIVVTVSLRRVNAENERLLERTRYEADTDALTGLPNRRSLMRDLARHLGEESGSLMLALFDLDGFKEYNDTFGHPTGDALLARMGDRLRRALEGRATAYRMGGDEFCVLAAGDPRSAPEIALIAAQALSEKGEAFSIGCSYGTAYLPEDAGSARDALRIADDRMYENKSARASASRQSTDVLVMALAERSPGLGEHLSEVATLASRTAERMGLPEPEVRRVKLAAELHDVGKVAIPDTILLKPGPLDDEEWEFMRRHTVIGERIVGAAPCLAPAAELVRSSHERHDGRGYPDHLAGDRIPLGASIIAVCDAFEAMTSTRPYSDAISVVEAVAELRRCSGAQFNPTVVEVFCELIEADCSGELRAA
jgi:diguanylate cyclase (GGDEF)-like protein